MHLLGEDQYGVWLYGPANTPYVSPRGRHGVWVRHITLIPRHDWWTAVWNSSGRLALYVDIATPAEWLGNRVRLVDLDLDVVRLQSGRVIVMDEDEFEDHRVALGYPDDVIAHAAATAHRLAHWLRLRVEPFGIASSHWWART